MKPINEPIILINLIDIDPKDNEAFKKAWAEDTFGIRVPAEQIVDEPAPDSGTA